MLGCFTVFLEGPRPSKEQIKHLRSYMILYIKKIVLKGQGAMDDEIQALNNFLMTVHEVRRVTSQPHI